MFLAATQFLATTVILTVLSLTKKIEIPPLNRGILLEVLPISLMFLGNVITGLGSTQSLNLPMFTALRRFSILITMLGEFFLLKREASAPIVISVALMVGGALIAAIYDLTFDLVGYILVLLNDLFTAMNGIYMKKATLSGQCTKMGILYYNSLFSLIAVVIIFATQYIQEMNFDSLRGIASPVDLKRSDSSFSLQEVLYFEGWSRIDFVFFFVTAALMGSILNYSIFLCTTYNSALTTTVIGCLKNVLTTYIGMLFMGDYAFTWLNFIGLNVSISGSLYYTYVTMIKGTPGFGSA
jgi:solute carrier family 35 protein